MGLVIPFRAFDLEQYYIYTAILLTILYCSRSTYTKIGTIQRRLAWPLRKDDTQIREAFYIFVRSRGLNTGRYPAHPLTLSYTSQTHIFVMKYEYTVMFFDLFLLSHHVLIQCRSVLTLFIYFFCMLIKQDD